MSPAAEAAARYLSSQPALRAAVAALTADLHRCHRRLHPDPARIRATRRRLELALPNHAA